MVLVLHLRSLNLRDVYKHTVEEEKAVVKPVKPRLSRNTFSFTVTNYIYQGAVFKATKIIIIKKMQQHNSNVTELVGGDDSAFANPNTETCFFYPPWDLVSEKCVFGWL